MKYGGGPRHAIGREAWHATRRSPACAMVDKSEVAADCLLGGSLGPRLLDGQMDAKMDAK